MAIVAIIRDRLLFCYSWKPFRIKWQFHVKYMHDIYFQKKARKYISYFSLNYSDCNFSGFFSASLSGISMSPPSNKTVSYKRVRVHVGCNGTQCNTTTIKKEPEYTQQVCP